MRFHCLEVAESRSLAFSLVEVAIALGIMAICSISVLALLLGGSRMVSDSWQRTAAVDAMVAVCESLKASSKQSDGYYYPKRPYEYRTGESKDLKDLVWKTGETTPRAVDFKVDKMGKVVDAVAQAELALHIDFDIPADANSQGGIYCSVAWPGGAVWMVGKGWSGCSGFIDGWIPFNVPNP